MKKKITKRNWYYDELVDGKAKAPGIAPDDERHLDGINRGEIQINDNSDDPTIFIRNNKGEIVGFKPSVDIDIEELKKLFLSRISPDRTDFLLELLGGVLVRGGMDADSVTASELSKFLGGALVRGGMEVEGGIDTDSLLTNLLSSENFESGDLGRGFSIFRNGKTHFSIEIDEIYARLKSFFKEIVSDTISSKDFSEGSFGSGFVVRRDPETGNSYIEVDELLVRMKAIFTELVIEKLSHVGGQMLLTPASMVCINVEETELAYRCYFKSTDGEKSIYNEFVVDDQATIREFNIKSGHQNVSNRYYWRLVTAIGDDYIDLSKTDCDAGSGIPQAGDNICQLGNRTIKERQDAQILSSSGSDAPSFKQYVGINGYSLKDKVESRLEPGNNELSGIVHIKNGSTGAGNLTDLPIEIQKAADLGSVNLLRNSGLTGQYENEELTPETELGPDSELYNNKLSNWTGIATVQEDKKSVSGYSATLGSLSQTIKLIIGENYVVSYKASGTSVAVSCGNYSISQPITDVLSKYVHRFKFAGTQLFLISGTAVLCDLKLERGSMATDWTPSPLDNNKSMAEMQSLSYIQDGIRNGSIDMIGGLMLSNMIMTGNYKDGKMQKVTAGMSGVYNDDDDVAFWAGGTFEQAIRTVMFYKDNPNAIPTAEELKLMANFAVTHGGRAILNDIIARGVFIVQSSGKTIEQELEGMSCDIAEVETRFEVKEGQVASSVKETKSYAQSASDSSTSAAGSATSAAGSATSASGSASNAAGSAAASEASKVISVEKASEAKQTAEGFQATVTETTKKAVTDAVNGANEVIEEKVGTAVTQNAKEWKVEVMGADAQGNPNTVLAAINADASGIKIKGDKVEIDGTLLAKIIMATGLNINDKFIVGKDGKMESTEGTFWGSVNTPYVQLTESDAEDLLKSSEKPGLNITNQSNYLLKDNLNVICVPGTITLPDSPSYNGHHVSIVMNPKLFTRIDMYMYVIVENGGLFGGVSKFDTANGILIRAKTISFYDGILNVSAVLMEDVNKVRWFVETLPNDTEIQY